MDQFFSVTESFNGSFCLYYTHTDSFTYDLLILVFNNFFDNHKLYKQDNRHVLLFTNKVCLNYSIMLTPKYRCPGHSVILLSTANLNEYTVLFKSIKTIFMDI